MTSNNASGPVVPGQEANAAHPDAMPTLPEDFLIGFGARRGPKFQRSVNWIGTLLSDNGRLRGALKGMTASRDHVAKGGDRERELRHEANTQTLVVALVTNYLTGVLRLPLLPSSKLRVDGLYLYTLEAGVGNELMAFTVRWEAEERKLDAEAPALGLRMRSFDLCKAGLTEKAQLEFLGWITAGLHAARDRMLLSPAVLKGVLDRHAVPLVGLRDHLMSLPLGQAPGNT